MTPRSCVAVTWSTPYFEEPKTAAFLNEKHSHLPGQRSIVPEEEEEDGQPKLQTLTCPPGRSNM